ncbi:hypothetical protein D3C72_2234420 [compost metagenome]
MRRIHMRLEVFGTFPFLYEHKAPWLRLVDIHLVLQDSLLLLTKRNQLLKRSFYSL